MTKKERVLRAITRRETDFIPFSMGFTQQARDKAVRYFADERFEDKINNHFAGAYYAGEPIMIKPGFFRDDFGVIWNRTGADKDIGVIDKLTLPEPAIGSYRFPEPPAAMLRKICGEALASAGDCFTGAALGFSLFERAWTLAGMENILMYMLTDPQFVHDLLDEITVFNIKLIRVYLEYDFDFINFGDDWGQQKGLIMGPNLWRAFIKPRLAQMYALVKEHGKFVFQHSCGDISEVLDDAIEIGLDVYETFQPEIYGLQEAKTRWGSRLSFFGGLSTQRLLPFETPENVIKKAAEIMRIMGKDGGYIAAPTHSIPGDVPPENIEALMELFHNQAKYGGFPCGIGTAH
ncbi:MAG: uroporphyrinogen decarboxylase family protein [Defluviitaleaceae bacterium]|nr:uroporphyrinogen decarboxylase family protein [Defluviitaleaceae bacterium]MCL2835269.1 uroporphyrinogen decarboxylase family protein [Defluviitaleaceae bacterium]